MAISDTDERPVSYEATLLVRDTCICLHVQRAARALARRFDAILAPHDLTNGQFSLLMSLNRPEPPGMGSVAALLAMDRTTLTAALKPLQRRGLVDILVDPADKRSRRLLLTRQGQELLAVALPLWCEAHERMEQQMGPQALDDLRAGLASLGR